jgi:hypothetical protein
VNAPSLFRSEKFRIEIIFSVLPFIVKVVIARRVRDGKDQLAGALTAPPTAKGG